MPDDEGPNSNRVIQGLWIGPELSVMERMCVASFLANGHAFHLYVYDDVTGVPEGAVVMDGNEVLPSSMIFQYKHHQSFAGFANFFRYKLLLDRGGWWADMDTVCLKPFDFAEEYVFATEFNEGEEITTSGIIKAPPSSPLMGYAWEVCRAKDTGEIVWGETGPRLMAEAVRKFSLEGFRKPPQAFCPLGHAEWRKMLDPNLSWEFGPSTYAIHLWNEKWRRTRHDKNQRYHPDCLYEQLKRRYLPQ